VEQSLPGVVRGRASHAELSEPPHGATAESARCHFGRATRKAGPSAEAMPGAKTSKVHAGLI